MQHVRLIIGVITLVVSAGAAFAGVVYWEGFNYYSNGHDIVEQSDGKWVPWGGPDNSDGNVVTNYPARFANTLRLTQLDAGNAGFSEICSAFAEDTFAYMSRASVTFSMYVPTATVNDDFYLWFCSGDMGETNSAYTASGPGGIVVNWTGDSPAAPTASLHLWNDLTFAKVADITKGAWHDVRMDLYKFGVGTTGGVVGITIDGTYKGFTYFPLANVDNITNGKFNWLDFYAMGDDIMYIDNIVVQDIPVDIEATNFYVSMSGNDGNDGLTPGTAWRNLSTAINNLCNPASVSNNMIAVPVPTNKWVVINVGTGVYLDVANNPTMDAAPRDVYRFGYEATNPTQRSETWCHNFLLIRGAGIDKTIFVQTYLNEFKFKVFSRFFRLEDCAIQAASDAAVSFYNDVVQMRPADGLGIDYRVERVRVYHTAATPGTLSGQRGGIGFIEAWQHMRNKVVRGCVLNNLGSGVKNFNNVSLYPLLVENCVFMNLPGDYGARGNGLIFEGAGGWVKNCQFVNIGVNATGTDRGHAIEAWPIVGANLTKAFSDIMLESNNFYNIGVGGTNYLVQQVNASFIRDFDTQSFNPFDPFNPLADIWSTAGRNNQRQGWYTNGVVLTVATILWTNDSAKGAGDLWGSGIRLGSAVTDGEKLYAAVCPAAVNNNAGLLALDPANGTSIWKAVLGGAGRYLNGTPAVGGSMVYIGEILDGPNQFVYGVNRADGTIVWSNSVDTMNGAAMLVHDGKLYFDTDWNAGALWCLDAGSGAVLWSNAFAGGNWGSSGSAVSPDGTAIYNHGDDSRLHAVDANNGATLWTDGPYADGEGNNEPIVDANGNVYCMFPGITNGSPSAIVNKYAPNGSNLWRCSFGSQTEGGGLALSPDGATLYATISSPSTNMGLLAIDTAIGAERWRVYAGKCGSSPVVAAPGNIIITIYAEGSQIYARGVQDDGASGTILWSVSLGPVHGGWLGPANYTRPAVLPNGNVIVENPSGVIACLTVPEPVLVLGMLMSVLALLRRR
jgi:hypothetical protein